MNSEKTISTPQLWELWKSNGVGLGRSVSLERGRAHVEVITPTGS